MQPVGLLLRLAVVLLGTALAGRLLSRRAAIP
jgi:hypothetical protein